MKEKKSGLKSNLKKVDNHKIGSAEYSDIPELPEEFFLKGQLYENGKPIKRPTRGKQKKPTKKQLTIRLNNDVVDYFKEQGNGWQTSINDILQEYVDSHSTA